MALLSLLREGIERSLESEAADFLSGIEGAEAREAGLRALRRLPEALLALCALEWQEETPLILRTLLPLVTTYMFKEDNLIPTRDGQILAGALDDAYLAFAACSYAAESQLQLSFASEKEAIATLLPAEVVAQLDANLQEALDDARRAIESTHLDEV